MGLAPIRGFVAGKSCFAIFFFLPDFMKSPNFRVSSGSKSRRARPSRSGSLNRTWKKDNTDFDLPKDNSTLIT